MKQSDLIIFVYCAAIVAALMFTHKAEAWPGLEVERASICGIDTSSWKVIDRKRFFDKNEEFVAEVTLFGVYPKPVQFMIMTVMQDDGTVVSVAKFAANPDTVVFLNDCHIEPEAAFIAANEHYMERIEHVTVIPHQPGA